MTQAQSGDDYDKTVTDFSGDTKATSAELPFAPVAVAAQGRQALRNPQYIAQQSSITEYTPGLNPLVNAAAPLLLEMILLRDGKTDDLENLRFRMEAEMRGFSAQAQALGVNEAHITAARYVLCTALDESITSSTIPGARGGWSPRSLLRTFHNETWGGERFFQVLERVMQQPANNLYILELIYLLLSFGFEGKYKFEDRGPLALEALRDQLYRQIRLLRGEARMDLANRAPARAAKSKIYAYVPLWLVGVIVAVCLSVTFWGFSHILAVKADPLLAQLAGHTPSDAPYVEKEDTDASAGEQTDADSETPAAGR